MYRNCRLRCSTPASVSSRQLFRFHLERCGRRRQSFITVQWPRQLDQSVVRRRGRFHQQGRTGTTGSHQSAANGRTSRPLLHKCRQHSTSQSNLTSFPTTAGYSLTLNGDCLIAYAVGLHCQTDDADNRPTAGTCLAERLDCCHFLHRSGPIGYKQKSSGLLQIHHVLSVSDKPVAEHVRGEVDSICENIAALWLQ